MVIFTIISAAVFGVLFVITDLENWFNLFLKVLFFGMMVWALLIGVVPLLK